MINRHATQGTAAHKTLSEKGLKAGSVGLIGAVVIGVSCIAPAYTLTAALGPTVSEVGVHLPAIFLVGFIPMLLVALGYRELNNAMPDAGTSFTWATRAFGPWIGWMGGWGLIAATIIVLSNLAAVAVDFFYLMLAQLFGNPELGRADHEPAAEHRHHPGVHRAGLLDLLPRHGNHQGRPVRPGGVPAAGARLVRRGGLHPRGQRLGLRRHGHLAGLVQPVRRGLLLLLRRRRVAVDLHLLGLGRDADHERGDPEPGKDAGPGRDRHRRW